MEERIPQRPREAQAPTVAEQTPTTAGTPCDSDDASLGAPVVQLLPSSSGEEGERDLDFEFPFVSRESPAGTAAPADELFAGGRIRTLYPVFGRGAGCVVARGSTSSSTARPTAPPPRVRGQLGQLFLEETRERNSSTSSTSSSSSAATDDNDGLEGAAPESYCVWRPGLSASPSPSPSPSPRSTPPRKSGSTGSMARPRWHRISDLVVGRSHSDGREKFLFLAAAPPAHHDAPRRHYKKPGTATATATSTSPAPAAGAYRKPPPPPPVAAPATEAADAAAHRMAYLARGGVPPGGTPRRTFLPYREELVGFFANVNGISRSHHHPF